MAWNNQYQQNNSGLNNLPYTQNTRNKKLILALIAVAIVLCAGFIVFIVSNNGSSSDADRAKAAARKEIPNAEVKQVVVADGFAMATVYVPKDKSQLGSGNTTIFKVNKDGSMVYITSASYFSPVDLLGFGIPFETQAKLRETDVNSIGQELANSCNYNYDNTPGYSGFEGSFNPDGWQIDSASLEGITQALNTVVESSNSSKETADKTFCVNAIIKGSDVSVDKTTYASTFMLKLQFITGNGVITDHNFTFSDGPIYSRSYTLDGQKIGN